MNNFINSLYKNHSLIYKILLFIATILLIVYVFPKSGKFKYSFEKGKPWQSENLYAPFDFAIKKSNEELQEEEDRITNTVSVYFNVDSTVINAARTSFDDQFQSHFSDSISEEIRADLYAKGVSILEAVYNKGVLDKLYSYDEERPVVLVTQRNQIGTTLYSNFIKSEDLRVFIEQKIAENGLLDQQSDFISIFFEVIRPIVSLDSELSTNVLQEELDKISAVRGSIAKETLIISKGEVVVGEKYNILRSLQLEYESQEWGEYNFYWIVTAYTMLVALALLMLLLFLKNYRSEIYKNNTKVTFIFFNILFVILLTTFTVNFNSEFLYVVPICILPLILKAFFDARTGLFAHVITVLLLGFIVPNNYEYMFLQIIAGIVTILTVSELYKRVNLFISVAQITMIYIVAYFAFFVIHEGSIEGINWDTFLLFVLCGLATLFVLPLIYAYEKLFGLVSDVSLLELSNTNSKLLKELSNKAPGTFHHSLNVANLAEASANEIGANAMLVRVGALYHDIGKMKNPTYFTENQSTGINPHDELSATESASIIINHVIDGIELAKKHNLPDRIIDFIRTHHGTNLVYYFFSKAKDTSDVVDEEKFRYPGPRPFSRETSILMMCDSVEAASKSLKEPTSTKINAFVENIISKQMDDDQFLNADITFKEIEAVKKVLKQKLANIYHLRIEYPE